MNPGAPAFPGLLTDVEAVGALKEAFPTWNRRYVLDSALARTLNRSCSLVLRSFGRSFVLQASPELLGVVGTEMGRCCSRDCPGRKRNQRRAGAQAEVATAPPADARVDAGAGRRFGR